jgi:rubrerythrin
MPRGRGWRRRDAVLGSALAATTLVAGSRLAQPVSAQALADGDVPVLQRALRLEQTLAVAYEFVAESGELEPEVQEAALLFAGQEREHAEALTSALLDLGGTPERPPEPDLIEGLVALTSQPAMLEFLVELERDAVAVYGGAAMELTAPDLLKTGAQIVCNEAQHLVVLRQQLGEEAVPAAFETGTAEDGLTPPNG